jgi:hypothetical protein
LFSPKSRRNLEITHNPYEFNHTYIRLANIAVRYPERLFKFQLKKPAALSAVLRRLPAGNWQDVSSVIFFQVISTSSLIIISLGFTKFYI